MLTMWSLNARLEHAGGAADVETTMVVTRWTADPCSTKCNTRMYDFRGLCFGNIEYVCRSMQAYVHTHYTPASLGHVCDFVRACELHFSFADIIHRSFAGGRGGLSSHLKQLKS